MILQTSVVLLVTLCQIVEVHCSDADGNDDIRDLGNLLKSWVLTEADIRGAVETHNYFRQEFIDDPLNTDYGPISWDPVIAKSAQRSADLCLYGHTKAVGKYDIDGLYGENIAYRPESLILEEINTTATIIHLLTLFGNERDTADPELKCGMYKYVPNFQGESCGHYTAMIAEVTTKFGCGLALCRDKDYEKNKNVLFCQYSDIGNKVRVCCNEEDIIPWTPYKKFWPNVTEEDEGDV